MIEYVIKSLVEKDNDFLANSVGWGVNGV